MSKRERERTAHQTNNPHGVISETTGTKESAPENLVLPPPVKPFTDYLPSKVVGYQPKSAPDNTVPPPVKSAARLALADVADTCIAAASAVEKLLTAPTSRYFKTATVTYVSRDKTFEQEIQYESNLLKAVRATLLEGLAIKRADGTTYVFAQNEIIGAYFKEPA